MSNEYIPTHIHLTEGQMKKLARAIKNSSEVSLLINKHQIKKKGNTDLLLTKRQITRFNKVKSDDKGITLTLSKTQISKMRKKINGKEFMLVLPKGAKECRSNTLIIQSLGNKLPKNTVEES